jgi:hemolysin activation/secretion protein
VVVAMMDLPTNVLMSTLFCAIVVLLLAVLVQLRTLELLSLHAFRKVAWALATVVLVLGTCIFLSSPSWAQTPPVPAVSAVRPIQDPAQPLLDQQRDQARQRALNESPATISGVPAAQTLDIPLGTPVDQIVESGPTFAVSKIELEAPTSTSSNGNPSIALKTILKPAQIDAITAPFVGRALGAHRLNVLLKRLADAFVAAGYVTTRAFLGPQNLETGTLKVTVQVGRVESFTINGQPIRRIPQGQRPSGGALFTDAGTENAFSTTPGDALNLEDLDQGVSQINRLRRNQAEVQILPGQTPGDSVVAVTNHPGDGVNYSLGVDNYGNSATGVTRYRAGIEADNLIGLQESISLNFLDSLDSNAIVGSIAVPYGRHTFSYTLSDSEYQELIGTSALLYGRTLSHIFGWNYSLDRTQAGSTNLDATLSWRRTDREVNDVALDTQRLAVLRVGGNWLRKFVVNDAPGNVTLDAGISEGLPWLEADHDPQDAVRGDAHSQFTKLDASASFTVPLPKLGKAAFVYRGAIGGQYTNVALYGSEQLYLGGNDSIRGFRTGEIAGDRGVYSRNEIAAVNVPSVKNARIEPYAFFDAGKAGLVATAGFPTLMGIGAGLRAQWQWHKQTLSGELLVGRALIQPAILGSKATLVLGNLTWNY